MSAKTLALITVKFLGGAKKSFLTDSILVDMEAITVQELLDHLELKKPENTPRLEPANILIAINGTDSSAMGGKSAKIHSGDIVTIIPVIHGGSSRMQLYIKRYSVEIFSITQDNSKNYLDSLRDNFPKLTLQAVSKRYVLNMSHVQKILTVSFHAKKQNILLAKKLETDILLRFAGTSQISKAITRVGISKGGFLIIAIGPRSSLDRLYSMLKPKLDTRAFSDNTSFLIKEFKITKRNIEAVDSKTPLEDLLAERAAVLF